VIGQRGGMMLRVALLGTLVLLVSCAAVGYVRVTAVPDLGAPPRGPSSGTTQAEVAASAAAHAALGLLTASHTRVNLSEQDLTVVVAANNHEPAKFHEPTARVRDGLVVVTADTDFGPLSVTAVGRVALALVTGSGGLPDVAAQIQEIDAGQVTLPGFLRDAIARRVQGSVALGHLLAASPNLARLRPYLECVAVSPDSVVLGFRRPQSPPQPGACV
jgi:hypothetical protein